MTRFNIACLIQAKSKFYTGSGWNKDVRTACLYTQAQAETIQKELAAAQPDSEIRYVVQNKSSNFHDGGEFASDLFWARLYTVEEAQSVLKDLSIKPPPRNVNK